MASQNLASTDEMVHTSARMSSTRAETLKNWSDDISKIVSKLDKIPHNEPDPDAIASKNFKLADEKKAQLVQDWKKDVDTEWDEEVQHLKKKKLHGVDHAEEEFEKAAHGAGSPAHGN